MIKFSAPAILVALLAGGGCGSEGHADEFFDCSTDLRATPYVSGQQVTSNGGMFTLSLESVPGPPIKGTNTWTILVKEAATDALLDGLNISVTPWMPDHAHGSKPVVVTPAGSGGAYSLKPVYLYMSGTWDVRFTVAGATSTAAAAEDTASIWTCIP